jgi:hypothetical protein
MEERERCFYFILSTLCNKMIECCWLQTWRTLTGVTTTSSITARSSRETTCVSSSAASWTGMIFIRLRISNKYGSLTRNKFLKKSVNMTYIQNTHRFRIFKLTFADWFNFSLIEEFTYEIDVWSQKKLINDALDLIWSPRALINIEKFYIYYLFLDSIIHFELVIHVLELE